MVRSSFVPCRLSFVKQLVLSNLVSRLNNTTRSVNIADDVLHGLTDKESVQNAVDKSIRLADQNVDYTTDEDSQDSEKHCLAARLSEEEC